GHFCPPASTPPLPTRRRTRWPQMARESAGFRRRRTLWWAPRRGRSRRTGRAAPTAVFHPSRPPSQHPTRPRAPRRPPPYSKTPAPPPSSRGRAGRSTPELGQRAPDSPHRLSDPLLVLDEREPDMAVAAGAEADPRADRDLRLAG